MNTPTLASPALDTGRHPARGRAAALRRGLRRAGRELWRALEAHGRARALLDLRHSHDRFAMSDPVLARRLRVAAAFLVAEGERRHG